MKKIFTILFLYFIGSNLYGQFTYSGYIYNSNGSGAVNVPVKLYKRTTTTSGNNSTSVKVYKTHNGTGSTSQYANYPSTRAEMDKCFNTSYSNTTLLSSTTMSGNSSLNFGTHTTLSSAGATLTSNGDYYAVEVTFTFTPLETGTYSFGLTSDDGSDLWLVNTGTIVTSYGGKGYGSYNYGSVSLTSGTSYSFIARMQEYGGGDGMFIIWKRPSQSSYSYQSAEVGAVTTTTSAWSLDATSNTNSSGYYSFSRTTTSNTEWYIKIDCPTPTQTFTSTDARAIGDVILEKTSKTGLTFHTYDLNDDSKITVSDKYYLWARKNLIFTTWKTAPNSSLFTLSEYNNIKAATTNVRVLYPGVSSVSTSKLTSGGTLNYYLISPGYSGQVTY